MSLSSSLMLPLLLLPSAAPQIGAGNVDLVASLRPLHGQERGPPCPLLLPRPGPSPPSLQGSVGDLQTRSPVPLLDLLCSRVTGALPKACLKGDGWRDPQLAHGMVCADSPGVCAHARGWPPKEATSRSSPQRLIKNLKQDSVVRPGDGMRRLSRPLNTN
ncbi:uncharacterized protein LOC129145595 isoform X1 [Talpa occidentalis]|uniref:uncharacterized protein LOC129145595 isoform X1 n=1 Tax=Talpa occidentalis TaxID=50954 RepID=UPI0023F9405B|nr:uncharacterized protein LOC129145595 isoform X1 [Talpa occidentalis]